MKKRTSESIKELDTRENLIPESTYPLSSYDGVGRFQSIWRAIRRGKASPTGQVYPNRPFNNSKSTRGRRENENRKRIYDQLKLTGLQRAN